MRALACALGALLVVSLPAKAVSPFVELSPGLISSNDGGTGWLIGARVGAQTDWFTPALVAFTAPGDPGPISHFKQEGGVQAMAVALEVRVHNPGQHQLSAGAGLGWGALLSAQDTDGDNTGLRGEPSLYAHAVFGYRLQLGAFRLGLDATLRRFNRTRVESDVGAGYRGGSGAFGLALALGFNLKEL